MTIEDYCEGDAFQAEKRTVFADSWLPLCAERQVAQPGDYLSTSVGGWSVVAVRGQDGSLNVLRNACRHQNMPVVNAGIGHCTNFRCRFHGWTYDLAGKFQSAPPQFAPTESQTERDLLNLATASEGGLLFFALGRPASRPQLGVLEAYGGTIAVDIDANWKVVVEHLLEVKKEFHFPLLALSRDGAQAIMHQIVPHTFLRTRLFVHGFGKTSQDDQPAADTIKAACEGLQAERAGGAMPVEGDFHIELKRALEGGTR